MILESTKRKIIALFILATFLVAMYCFCIINIGEKNEDILVMSQKLSDAKAKKSALLSMQRNLLASKDKASELENFILKAGGEVEFIKKIEDLAISSNVKSEIKTARVEQLSGGDSAVAESFRVGLDAIGSWSDVIYLLTSIETLPLKMTINSVSLSKFSDYEIKGQKISQWLLSIDFSVIKQKQI